MGGPKWSRFLIYGAAFAALGLPAPMAVRALVLQVVGWASIVMMVRAVRAGTPSRRLPWYGIAAAGGFALLGGLVRAVHSVMSGDPDPFPSPADAFFVSAYLCVLAGEVMLIRFRTVEVEREHLIDAAIVAIGVGVLLWAVFLAPYVRDGSVPLEDRALNVGFSMLTIAMLTLTARLAVGPGIRNPSYYLLAGAIAVLFACDFLTAAETGGAKTGGIALAITPFIYVFFASAAMHPSMARLTETPPDQEVQLTWKRKLLLAAALLVAPGVLVSQLGRGRDIDLPVIATGSVLLSLLVLARLSGMVRAKERTAERERVLHEVGTALVVATSRDEILEGTLAATLALVRGCGDTRATVLMGTEDELEVVASAGVGHPDPPGTKMPAGRLPAELRAGLLERRVVRAVSNPDTVPAPGGDLGGQTVMVLVPLVSKNELRGAIVVSATGPVPRETVQALTSLSSEVALALESAALTESLLRRRSEARFRALIENSSDLVVVLGADDMISFVSPASQHLLGYSERFYVGRDPLQFVHPDDSSLVLDALAATSPENLSHEPVEVRLGHANGSYRWFELLTRDLRDEPDIAGVVINAREITDRKGAEQLLARSEARFRALVQNSSDVVAVIDDRGFFIYVSPSITGMLGYKPDELVGTSALALLPPDDVASAMRASEHLSESPFEQASGEVRVRDRDRDWHTVVLTVTDLRDEPAVEGIVLNARDVTVRKELERDLRKQALHDALTGLGNRTMFTDRVTHALARRDDRHVVAVLFVDLDDFKTVNDSLGHEIGDELLVLVAERLRTCVREADTAARLGGDEFAVLLETAYDEDDVAEVADRVLDAMRMPFPIDDRVLAVTASVGIVVSADRAASAEVLLRNADMAMYLAKERGKDRAEVFEEEMHATVYERLELRTDLAHGIENGDLRLHYQPIVELQSGQIVGAEALVRWEHPHRGLLSPDVFVHLAEDTGLVVPMGQWVLNEACRQLGRWRRTLVGGALHSVSVNLSVRQLQTDHIVDEVAATLVRHGLRPEDLTLEITESMLMSDTDSTRRNLRGLHDLGVSLAVDDFGTGYSSLGSIKTLPVDTIKIDRTFVDGLGAEDGDEGVVRAVVGLAHGMRVKTVAEGIEGAVQLDRLRELGCELGQGYYFSRPVEATDFEQLVEAGLRGEAFGWERPETARPTPLVSARSKRRRS